MARLKVAITDYEFADLSLEEGVLAQLKGVEFIKGQCRTEDDVIKLCRDVDGIISQYAPLGRRVIESLDQCRVISRYGVGVNTIDIEAATAHGICVGNVTDYCMDEVSDHALALLLSWARKVTLLDRQVKSGVWDFKRGEPITRFQKQTVGVLGFGRIPQSLVKKLLAIGFRVKVFDPYVSQAAIEQAGAEKSDLEAVLTAADFVTVHVPLTAQTEGLLSTAQFKMMKKSAVVINTSRGPVIDEAALVNALQTGEIAGAALDVIEQEPIRPDHPLLQMEQVILTPHIAWYSEESQVELRTKAMQNVVDVLSGYYPTYLFNQNVKEKVTLMEKTVNDSEK